MGHRDQGVVGDRRHLLGVVGAEQPVDPVAVGGRERVAPQLLGLVAPLVGVGRARKGVHAPAHRLVEAVGEQHVHAAVEAVVEVAGVRGVLEGVVEGEHPVAVVHGRADVHVFVPAAVERGGDHDDGERAPLPRVGHPGRPVDVVGVPPVGGRRPERLRAPCGVAVGDEVVRAVAVVRLAAGVVRVHRACVGERPARARRHGQRGHEPEHQRQREEQPHRLPRDRGGRCCSIHLRSFPSGPIPLCGGNDS